MASLAVSGGALGLWPRPPAANSGCVGTSITASASTQPSAPALETPTTSVPPAATVYDVAPSCCQLQTPPAGPLPTIDAGGASFWSTDTFVTLPPPPGGRHPHSPGRSTKSNFPWG